MKYKSNRNIVFSCSYHVVFCPKYRRPVLVDGVDERFKEIAWEVADELGFEIAEMEVMPDHVHLLLSIDPQLTSTGRSSASRGGQATTYARSSRGSKAVYRRSGRTATSCRPWEVHRSRR